MRPTTTTIALLATVIPVAIATSTGSPISVSARDDTSLSYHRLQARMNVNGKIYSIPDPKKPVFGYAGDLTKGKEQRPLPVSKNTNPRPDENPTVAPRPIKGFSGPPAPPSLSNGRRLEDISPPKSEERTPRPVFNQAVTPGQAPHVVKGPSTAPPPPTSNSNPSVQPGNKRPPTGVVTEPRDRTYGSKHNPNYMNGTPTNKMKVPTDPYA